jgi:hypothetical protein
MTCSWPRRRWLRLRRGAWAKLRVAVSWHQAADRELSALTKPTSGGAVDRWFRAAAAVEDCLQSCEAFEAFPPYTGQ